MGFKEVATLDTDNAISLGGRNKKTGKPNPKQIEGYFLGTKGGLPNKFDPNKPNCMHVFQTADGNVGVWGKTDLDRKLRSVVPGTMVRATWTGTRPSSKGNDMLVFKVEVDADNTIAADEVPSVESYGAQTDDEGGNYGAYSEDEGDDAALDEDEAALDEAPPARAKPPTKAAQTPSADRQAEVQRRLGARRSAS